jgi:hypothetical protein
MDGKSVSVSGSNNGVWTDPMLLPTEGDQDSLDSAVVMEFKAGADPSEGINGRKAIDTEFETYAEDMIDHPRSDRTTYDGGPAPTLNNNGKFPHRWLA